MRAIDQELLACAWHGLPLAVEALLQKGANPAAVNDKRMQPLGFALRSPAENAQIISCIKLLLPESDESLLSSDGELPLEFVAGWGGGAGRLAAVLAERPLAANQRNAYGRSLLGAAAEVNRVDELRLLLSLCSHEAINAVSVHSDAGVPQGAIEVAKAARGTMNLREMDWTSQANFPGATPLMEAIYAGSLGCCELLLPRSNLDFENAWGQGAMGVAQDCAYRSQGLAAADNKQILKLVEERYCAWQEEKMIEAATVETARDACNKKGAPRI